MGLLNNNLDKLSQQLGLEKQAAMGTGRVLKGVVGNISNYFKNKSLANRLKNNYNTNNFALNNLSNRLKDAPQVSISAFLLKNMNNGIKKGL